MTAAAIPAQTRAEIFRRDIAPVFKDEQSKILRLAEAIPAEYYDWRPTESARSIAEVLLHLSDSDSFCLDYMKRKTIADEELKQMIAHMMSNERRTAAKDEVITALKASADSIEQSLNTTEDLDADLDFFGSKPTVASMYAFQAAHWAEHLGQLVAYARMIGTMPPWSQSAR